MGKANRLLSPYREKITEYKKLQYLDRKTLLLLPFPVICDCQIYINILIMPMFISFVLKELTDGEVTISSGRLLC